MKYPRYQHSSDKDLHIFEFVSVGRNGSIKKIIQYTEMSVEGYYNLAFGDLNEETGDIDDKVITNNGDSLKVLSTVASSVYAFTGKYPTAKIFATGSSESRTRLYRMGISNNLEELKQDFLVYDLTKDEVFEEFIACKNYLGFLVTRKKK